MESESDFPALDTNERFLAQVAWAYFVEDMTQAEVAQKLGVTRLRVNRALAEARKTGLVRISFNTAYAAYAEAETELVKKFGLKVAYVAPAPSNPEKTQNVVGAALGNLLLNVLADSKVRLFGMAWGNTLNLATRSMAPLNRPDLEIVSVMGGLVRGSDLNSFEITVCLAGLVNARHSFLTAPLYAGSRSSRDTIMQLEVFAEILGKIRSVDALAMTAGDISERSMLMRDALPSDTSIADLRSIGAVGDILGTVIDAEGNPVEHPINNRVIGIGFSDLARISNVILAAGGSHKFQVTRAILNLGLVDTLVTDDEMARQLLA